MDVESLIRFHTAHAAALHARSKAAEELLGSIVAEGVRLARPELRQRYEKLFMTTLALPSTSNRRSNALERIELILRSHG